MDQKSTVFPATQSVFSVKVNEDGSAVKSAPRSKCDPVLLKRHILNKFGVQNVVVGIEDVKLDVHCVLIGTEEGVVDGCIVAIAHCTGLFHGETVIVGGQSCCRVETLATFSIGSA